MIQPFDPKEFPPTQICCDDSLRALSMAECDGWQKATGLPAGSPRNACADLRRIVPNGETEDDILQCALLCGPILDEDQPKDADPAFFFLLFHYKPEASILVTH